MQGDAVPQFRLDEDAVLLPVEGGVEWALVQVDHLDVAAGLLSN